MAPKKLSGFDCVNTECIIPDSKVHGANMGPIWDRQGPGGSHVGLMNLDILDTYNETRSK